MRKLLAFFLAWGVAQAAHAEVRNPHGVAVIVGNGDYEHRDVPDVAYASRDAAAFARYVTDVLGFDPENVIHVTDATRRRMRDVLGTKSEARGLLWSYLDPDGGSEVVVFYSGHGVPGQRDGRGYLLPVDADPKAAEDDGYPIDLLYENLGRLEEASSVRVYLDACFSGGSHGGGLIGSASPVFVKAALPAGLSGKVTALAAASGKQIASWDEKAKHGLFTHHLLDALYGKGDADGDGKVTGAEARAYLDRYMTRAARRQHRRVQRASLIGSDGAVLSTAPAGGFPARPATGPGGPSAPGAKADAKAEESAAGGKDGESVGGAGGAEPDRNSVERAKYGRGLSRARQEKDHAAVLSFLDRMEELGGEQPADGDFFRGEAAFFLGRFGSARAVLERYVGRGGGEYRDRSLDLLLELDEKDDAAFGRAKSADTAAGYEAYLSSWPGGRHAEEAGRLEAAVAARQKAERRAREEDDAAFGRAKSADTAAGYEGYLSSRPSGRHAVAAQRLLAAAREEAARAAEAALGMKRQDRILIQLGLIMLNIDPGLADGTFGPRTRAAIRSWQRAGGSDATGYLLRRQATALIAAGEKARRSGFRECPEMVVLPSGSFRMGSPSWEAGRADDEGPVRRVRIGYAFAVGKYEVTFAEWDACVSEGGCGGYRPPDRGWGRGKRPVINVSWEDAKGYVDWLSRKTGKEYRLLSESELEYAARAGTAEPFHTGGTISTDRANYNGNYVYGGGVKGVDRRKTVPVGSFGSNGFGLHDMHGNVWEWVEDCWNGSYAGAPSDGSAWKRGNCGQRVLRGGSWFNYPGLLRSANRIRYYSGFRDYNNGFRVARTLAR